jgi:hypothetical protein
MQIQITQGTQSQILNNANPNHTRDSIPNPKQCKSKSPNFGCGSKSQIPNNANPNHPTLDVGLNLKSQRMQIQIPQLWMWD